MSTSIRISDETKRKLEAIKRDDESFDELLARLTRTEKDVEQMAGFGPDGIAEHMEATRAELNDSFEGRTSPSEPRSQSDADE